MNGKKKRIAFVIVSSFLLALCFLPWTLLAEFKFPPLPDADYVSDQVGIVDEETRAEIKRLNEELASTGAQIVVTVIPSLDGQNLEMFSNALFREWGIGSADKDNGILLLVSMNDRKFRIEVGRGLEGAIPDGRAGTILREEMTPNFKNEEYSKGIKGAVQTIAALIADEYDLSKEALGVKTPSYLSESPLYTILGFVIFVAMFAIPILIWRRNRRLRRLGLYNDNSYYSSSSSSYNSSSSSSSSSSSGFSGGGGSSGGGGASGGW